jgi:hypothetical protein
MEREKKFNGIACSQLSLSSVASFRGIHHGREGHGNELQSYIRSDKLEGAYDFVKRPRCISDVR